MNRMHPVHAVRSALALAKRHLPARSAWPTHSVYWVKLDVVAAGREFGSITGTRTRCSPR